MRHQRSLVSAKSAGLTVFYSPELKLPVVKEQHLSVATAASSLPPFLTAADHEATIGVRRCGRKGRSASGASREEGTRKKKKDLSA